MPLMETSGNVTADAYAGGAAVAAKYIEQYFSTWLRTGTGASATITTGLDASTNKALVWTKSRSAATDHKLTDTVRGATKALISDTTGAQTTDTNGLTAFSSTGYTIGSDTNYNNSGATYVDWEFVATPKFFDVVTYTGDGTNNRQIPHSLASVPGCVIVKRLNAVTDWLVWHRSSGAGFNAATLNGTGTFGSSGFGPSTAFTDTYFTVANQAETNASGGTYVAYLFAHDAGGFGLTGTDNVISCGSYTGNGLAAGPVITLGYEPQWVLIKRTDSAASWVLFDNMRGEPVSGNANILLPNTSSAEYSDYTVAPLATGFQPTNPGGNPNVSGGTYIYIAIRRGPMKTPTSGTSVFFPTTISAIGASDWSAAPLSEKSVDCLIGNTRTNSPNSGFIFTDRLRGLNGSYSTSTSANLNSTSTAAETTATYPLQLGDSQGTIDTNRTAPNSITYLMKRAPGFFDEVCETSTSATNKPVTHNLAAVPELIIVKKRSASGTNWVVYASAVTTLSQYLVLNTTAAKATSSNIWGLSAPTSTTFNINESSVVGATGSTYVAYLFATCPGVSKVGSYTGTGATQTISCGFTGGARFVLIKRTDSTGDWYVWDTARGMVSGTDPSLLLNSTAAEVNANSVYTTTGGFQIVSTAAGINASGGTYIYLAIA